MYIYAHTFNGKYRHRYRDKWDPVSDPALRHCTLVRYVFRKQEDPKIGNAIREAMQLGPDSSEDEIARILCRELPPDYTAEQFRATLATHF